MPGPVSLRWCLVKLWILGRITRAAAWLAPRSPHRISSSVLSGNRRQETFPGISRLSVVHWTERPHQAGASMDQTPLPVEASTS
jgi:hypothetical protein